MLNRHLSSQSPLKQLAFVATAAVISLTRQALTICEYDGFVQKYQHPPPSLFPCAVYLKWRDQHHGTKEMGLDIKKYSITGKMSQR